jgi:hypothetical protein
METHQRKWRWLETAIDVFSIVMGVAAILLIVDVLSQPSRPEPPHERSSRTAQLE